MLRGSKEFSEKKSVNVAHEKKGVREAPMPEQAERVTAVNWGGNQHGAAWGEMAKGQSSAFKHIPNPTIPHHLHRSHSDPPPHRSPCCLSIFCFDLANQGNPV